MDEPNPVSKCCGAPVPNRNGECLNCGKPCNSIESNPKPIKRIPALQHTGGTLPPGAQVNESKSLDEILKGLISGYISSYAKTMGQAKAELHQYFAERVMKCEPIALKNDKNLSRDYPDQYSVNEAWKYNIQQEFKQKI